MADYLNLSNNLPNNSELQCEQDRENFLKRLKPGVAFFLVVARMFAPSVGTMMDGEHAFATSGVTAWRRRQRRLRRYVLWHSKMEIAAAIHHTSRQRTSTTTAATQTVNYVFVSAAATYAATASVHVIGYVTPSLVLENIAPAPAVTSDVHSQQLPPVYTTTTVTTDDNLDITGLMYPQFSSTAVESFSPHVVGSLPPLDEFTEPVFNPVHQEQIVAGEMTQNIIENSAVQEQVVVSLPPLEEFTEPVFNQVHHEQIAAGETTENIAEFPVVQEQVIVQAIPEVVDSLPPVEEFTEPGYNQVHHEQIVAGEMTQDMLGNSAMQDQVIVQDIPEVVERIQEAAVLVTAPMIERAPPVAEDVQSAQVGDIMADNLTDLFAQALVPLDTAISQYLGHLKAMNDQVSSHERTLEERRRQFDARVLIKSIQHERRQLENEFASISHDIQCERDKITEVKSSFDSDNACFHYGLLTTASEDA